MDSKTLTYKWQTFTSCAIPRPLPGDTRCSGTICRSRLGLLGGMASRRETPLEPQDHRTVTCLGLLERGRQLRDCGFELIEIWMNVEWLAGWVVQKDLTPGSRQGGLQGVEAANGSLYDRRVEKGGV